MFFKLFQRRPAAPGILYTDATDWHCHILAGPDHGAKNTEESLAILRCLKRKGIRRIFCTPHINNSYPHSTEEYCKNVFEHFQEAAQGEGVELRLGAEYMLDGSLEKRLKEGTPLISPADSMLLVEIPRYMLPPAWMDSLLEIKAAGYTPLLAHPERYYRLLDADRLERVHQQGILFQGNSGAFNNAYNKNVVKLAAELKRRGLYDCWGSDSHTEEMADMVVLNAFVRNNHD